MQFRWKLLILLIIIAIVPIIAMRTFGARSARSLANQLIAQSRDDLVSDTKSRLTFFIDSYAQLLLQKRMQLEMLLSLQAEEVNRALAAAPRSDSRPFFLKDFDGPDYNRSNLISSPDHTPARQQNRLGDFLVSYEDQVFYPTGNAAKAGYLYQAEQLNTTTPFLDHISSRLGGLVLWHFTALENGITAFYPGHGTLIEDYDPRQQPWYAQTVKAGLLWSEQVSDPLTGQNVMILAMPVKDISARVVGATALMVPISRLLEGEQLQQNLPAATQSFLVALVNDSPGKNPGARILAHHSPRDSDRNAWNSPIEPDWLIADSPEQYALVLDDFKHGRSNVRRIRYNDCDCLWVYGPVHQDAFLLLTTPYHLILEPIKSAEGFIQGQIDQLLGVTRLGILAIIGLVVALAFTFARSVSKPMQILAEGARRLSQGDFNTRVDIKSNDEFGAMGKVFNKVGPQLEAHWRLQQTLDLAREVQQHFLPRRSPEVPGLDIAGKSIYCEEIGGDYFDFIDLGGDANKIAVVIGDVSGHGVPSALLMTTARALLRQRVSLPGSLQQIVADVNVRLCQDIEESGQFMTLFYSELLPDEKKIRWVRAGHDPAFLYHPDSEQFEVIMGEGTTLGVSCDVHFEENQQDLQTSQILLLTTDGIRETRNQEGQMFGNSPMQQIVREHAGEDAETILSAILAALETFRGPGSKREDDATLVVIKVL